MKTRVFSLEQAAAHVLREVRAAETNAIHRGKPTMWAYYRDMADYLQMASTPPLTADVLALWIENNEITVNSFQHCKTRASAAAVSVYLRRILRLAGERVPPASLDWLRAEQRWDEHGEPLP